MHAFRLLLIAAGLFAAPSAWAHVPVCYDTDGLPETMELCGDPAICGCHEVYLTTRDGYPLPGIPVEPDAAPALSVTGLAAALVPQSLSAVNASGAMCPVIIGSHNTLGNVSCSEARPDSPPYRGWFAGNTTWVEPTEPELITPSTLREHCPALTYAESESAVLNYAIIYTWLEKAAIQFNWYIQADYPEACAYFKAPWAGFPVLSPS